MHPNTWTRLPWNTKKHDVTSTLLPPSSTSSSDFTHVHLQSSSSIHLPKSHGKNQSDLQPKRPKFQVPERLSSYFTSTKSPGLDFGLFRRFGFLKSPRSKYMWYVYHCKPIPQMGGLWHFMHGFTHMRWFPHEIKWPKNEKKWEEHVAKLSDWWLLLFALKSLVAPAATRVSTTWM